MLNLIVPENGNIEDAEMQVDFSGLKEYQPFMDAPNAFESYLEAYAAAAHIPQSVVSDICQLAANATTAAMRYAYESGLCDTITAIEESKKTGEQPFPYTVRNIPS